MTEAEWLFCTDPMPMLKFVQGKTSDRKLRLFACACCQRIWPLLTDDSRRAVEVAEWFADDQISKQELQTAFSRAAGAVHTKRGNTAYVSTSGAIGGPATAAYAAAFVGVGGYGAADGAAACAAKAAAASGGDEITEKARQADLLRDIVGPLPFCPIEISPLWRQWNENWVLKMADNLYVERTFALWMPVLADALEQAGCTNYDILNHCRQPGPHVRGCWVVDLLLGKR